MGSVDKNQDALRVEHKAIFDVANEAIVGKDKDRKRGRNKISAKLRRRQKNVVDAQTVKLKEKLAKEREERDQKKSGELEKQKDSLGVLARFIRKK